MTPHEVRRRVEAVERAAGMPLTPAEMGELARLDAARAVRSPVAEWDLATIDDYLNSGGDPEGTCERHEQLRLRARAPGQVASERDYKRMIDAMSLDQLDAYMAERNREAPSPSSQHPPGHEKGDLR